MLGKEKKLVIGLIDAYNPHSMLLEGFCDMKVSYTGDLTPSASDVDGYHVVTTLVSDGDITSCATLPIIREIGFITEYEGSENLARYVDCPNKDGWYQIKPEYCDGYASAVGYSFDLDETINSGTYVYTREEVAEKHTIVGDSDSLYVVSDIPNMAFQKLQYVTSSSLIDFTDNLPEFNGIYGRLEGFTVYMYTYNTGSGLEVNYYCVSDEVLKTLQKKTSATAIFW